MLPKEDFDRLVKGEEFNYKNNNNNNNINIINTTDSRNTSPYRLGGNSGSPNFNRSRIPNLIPTQPPTQQKRHNSQSFVTSTKRGALFQGNSSTTTAFLANSSGILNSSPGASGNPSSSTLANISTTSQPAQSQNGAVPGKKHKNIPGFTTSPAFQARNKAINKTPTPSTLEVPSSPKSRVISKVYETDMSVEGSSELNDVPHTRGSRTADNPHNSNSPESISEQKQKQQQQSQQQIPRRPSTETVVSQPPPQQQQQQQQQNSTSSSRGITEEEQILASNLQETYKAILKLEIETQQGCAEVNQKLAENDSGVEITPQLWSVYKNVVQLLDHYYDFLLYALSPSSARAGKPLVTNYRILRRMWVYGIVSFLEVLKNVATIFVEHEICACFIAYAFNIITCLTDSQLGVEGWWAEKLGDLSRMAIALYPARYMDWKLSSMYWYQTAMKTQFGHGKIYYHVCTVESDNLEALMNIGKAVSSRDPFVPSSTYLRMIVDNCCSQRNILNSIEMAMIDFVKIHKILLMPNYNIAPEMVNLVSHYATHFGMDSSNMDFFQLRFDRGSNIPVARVAFWFQKGPNFALCNISHLIGFGDSRNPFAKLFDLPDALRERKDKKDKRRKSKPDSNNPIDENLKSDVEELYNATARSLKESSWFFLLDFINKGVLELSMRMLKQYINGPLQTSTPHIIVWLYFIAAVGEAMTKYPESKTLFTYLMARYIPWSKLIPYLNDILCIVRASPETRGVMKEHLLKSQNLSDRKEILNYFAENEKLWEVWKCWGSLWFDSIYTKKDYISVDETGVKGDLFDMPTSGPRYNSKEDPGRYMRIVLLASYISENFPDFGLIKSGNIFKFKMDESIFALENVDPNVAYFSQDQRFQGLFEKPSAALTVTDYLKELFDIEKWCSSNDQPELPTWDYNSYAFMTEFINNNYPIPMGPNQDMAGNGENDEEADYEDGSSTDENPDQVDQSGQQPQYYDPTTIKIPGDLGDKMDTSLTYISLDTNTWLKHCGRIFKCVRSDIFRLAIPLAVFQELRSLRRSTDTSISDSATRAVLVVKQLYNEKDILPIRADGTKASSLGETTEFEQNQSWRTNTDEIIMKAIKLNDDIGKSSLLGTNFRIIKNGKLLNRLEASVFRYNILVTDDRNMGLRSKSMGLPNFQSTWLFEKVDGMALGRCCD